RLLMGLGSALPLPIQPIMAATPAPQNRMKTTPATQRSGCKDFPACVSMATPFAWFIRTWCLGAVCALLGARSVRQRTVGAVAATSSRGAALDSAVNHHLARSVTPRFDDSRHVRLPP